MKIPLLLFSLCFIVFAKGQCNLYGVLQDDQNNSLPFVQVTIQKTGEALKKSLLSDDFGRFKLENIEAGTYSVAASCMYHVSIKQQIDVILGDNEITLTLKDTAVLGTVDVYYDSPYTMTTMRMVQGLTLTNGKKTQDINLLKVDGNKATDNPRQLYAKVPGLTIWESDGGGLQLGIGTRGLSPSRTAHFNTRQNGYDISADALGYPETYYTPPSEALKSIQLIRGAASLQFGPQFGGMINFIMKDPANKTFEYQGSHTYGSFNLINTYNQFSGTLLNKRLTYFGYIQHKQGDGWRDNSDFNQQNAFFKIGYRFTERMQLTLEQTYMRYLAQQAGGLTDALFNQNPRQSIRSRNWFEVDWRITAANFNWEFNRKSTLDIKVFKVDAQRNALGNLEKISRADDGQERTLIEGKFQNFGAEARYLKRYPIGKKITGISVVGLRYYQGETASKQGLASANSDADFTFLNPTNLEGSDYIFPSINAAAFIENIFILTEKLSFSAGVRTEFINTSATGSYREQILHPLTGAIIFDTTFYEDKNTRRKILLGGIGFSYRKNKKTEIYGNIAQNYRGINFSDIRIVNPNQIVDPNIEDEKGFNADLGIRGQRKNGHFDFSGFFLFYDNKIGVVNQKVNEFEFVRVRTNVGAAYSTGIELFAEQQFRKTDSSKTYFSVFGNFSAVYAKYGQYSEGSPLSNNWIELVPPISGKIGLKYASKKWSTSLLGTYVHQHYSDGTNAISDPNAIAGLIPSYFVMDFNASYELNKHFTFKGGINNLTNNAYFTRRATAYPGPGIIPSDGISFFLTVGITL